MVVEKDRISYQLYTWQCTDIINRKSMLVTIIQSVSVGWKVINESVSQSVSQSVSKAVSQSVSQSGRGIVGQSGASQSLSLSVSQWGRSVSQPATQLVSHSACQPASLSVSLDSKLAS